VPRVIPNIIAAREVDPTQLGWISGKRATTRTNFPANFQYFDLRGMKLADLDAAIAEENSEYARLEAEGFTQRSIDQTDYRHAASTLVPMVDFGIGAAVVALSVLGCVPVTSCRGPTLGAGKHSQPAPMIVFYARRAHLATLMRAVEESDCQIVNNGAKLEIYADDLFKMHALALAIRRLLAPVPGAAGS
jgi:hypothetical protein